MPKPKRKLEVNEKSEVKEKSPAETEKKEQTGSSSSKKVFQFFSTVTDELGSAFEKYVDTSDLGEDELTKILAKTPAKVTKLATHFVSHAVEDDEPEESSLQKTKRASTETLVDTGFDLINEKLLGGTAPIAMTISEFAYNLLKDSEFPTPSIDPSEMTKTDHLVYQQKCEDYMTTKLIGLPFQLQKAITEKVYQLINNFLGIEPKKSSAIEEHSSTTTTPGTTNSHSITSELETTTKTLPLKIKRPMGETGVSTSLGSATIGAGISLSGLSAQVALPLTAPLAFTVAAGTLIIGIGYFSYKAFMASHKFPRVEVRDITKSEMQEAISKLENDTGIDFSELPEKTQYRIQILLNAEFRHLLEAKNRVNHVQRNQHRVNPFGLFNTTIRHGKEDYESEMEAAQKNHEEIIELIDQYKNDHTPN
ncbi:MAG: hypothetical protein WCW01_05685 [Gammaproteobacteria bacterium]